MWPPWLPVNITHCSVWSVFVVCDGDNYCLCVAVVVVVVVDWHHLDNEVSPLAALCDPIEAVGVVDGGVPGGKAAHLSSYYLAPLILSLVLLWNSHPSSILDQLHQRQWEEFPCKLLRRKLHFQGKVFFIFWPTIPTNPSHWYPSMLHPSKVVFFLDSSGFCLLYYSFVCDVWELEMWYCGGEFKWIYMSSAMSECCTIQYFDAFYKS